MRWIFLIILVGISVYVASQTISDEYLPHLFSNLSIITAITVTLFIVFVVKKYTGTNFHLAFVALFVGYIGYFLAEISYYIMELNGLEAYPSEADWLYLVFYTGAILHLVFTIRQFIHIKTHHILLLSLTVIVGVLSYSFVVLDEPMASYSGVFVIFNTILVVLSLFTALKLRKTILEIPWIWLSVGIMIGGLFDIVYYVREVTVGYEYGSIEDIMWIVSDVMILLGLYIHRKTI